MQESNEYNLARFFDKLWDFVILLFAVAAFIIMIWVLNRVFFG